MTRADLSDVYRGYIACLNKQDWPNLGRFVHEDVQYNRKRSRATINVRRQRQSRLECDRDSRTERGRSPSDGRPSPAAHLSLWSNGGMATVSDRAKRVIRL